MRALWVGALLAGCSFTAPTSGPDDAGVEGDAADAALDADPTARITDGLIALWTFDENGGSIVGDTSGVEPPISPTIVDVANISWAPGTLTVDLPADINTSGSQNRIVPACKVSDEVTLEAWVTPANTTQTGTTTDQPARIITFTVTNIGQHLIGIGQLGGVWAAQVRTDAAGLDSHGGNPILTNGVVETKLTHLVVVSTGSQRRLYVDGMVAVDDFGGLLDTWDPTFFVAIAGDPNRRNTWLGTIDLVAVYDRALSEAEVMTNHLAGP